MILNPNNRDGLFPSAAESGRAEPCPDVAWISASKLNVGKIAVVTSRSGLLVLQHRKALKENFSYLPFLTILKLEL
jgi:hypothetical protein